MYGASVFPKLSAEVLAGQSIPGAGWGNSSPEDQRRRSIYIHVKRTLSVPMLANFDAADTDATCPVRFNTTQPTQALGMLNSQFVNNEANELASLVAASSDELTKQVTVVLQRVTQKEPSAKEVEEGVEFIEQLRDGGAADDVSLQYFCLMALNLNEFVFLR